MKYRIIKNYFKKILAWFRKSNAAEASSEAEASLARPVVPDQSGGGLVDDFLSKSDLQGQDSTEDTGGIEIYLDGKKVDGYWVDLDFEPKDSPGPIHEIVIKFK